MKARRASSLCACEVVCEDVVDLLDSLHILGKDTVPGPPAKYGPWSFLPEVEHLAIAFVGLLRERDALRALGCKRTCDIGHDAALKYSKHL